MSVETIFALILFIGNIVLLGILSYKVLKFGELEEDHLNPTDFAKNMNSLFPIELAIMAGLSVSCFLTMVTGWAVLKLVLLLLNLCYLGYHGHLYTEGKWKVDAANVWSPSFKKKAQMTIMIGLVYCGLCFFLYLYNLLVALGHNFDDHKFQAFASDVPVDFMLSFP
mmetsp:Transcript_33425/g.51978  ORF Transcript_33425/g.51978 Transcript_33425/m.51978 type:complete len:167 (-) Transcript_33425:807-1307(-)